MHGGKIVNIKYIIVISMFVGIPWLARGAELECSQKLSPTSTPQEVIDAIKCLDKRTIAGANEVLIYEENQKEIAIGDGEIAVNLLGEWNIISDKYNGKIMFFNTIEGVKGQLKLHVPGWDDKWEPITKIEINVSMISFYRPQYSSDYKGYLVNGELRGIFVNDKKEYAWLATRAVEKQ